ncbi:hypothetical protein O181_121131, partial [Austropuccinia psidii MF-1]|nr:hypothetical protein [Austropuccinia psidii MF-1]
MERFAVCTTTEHWDSLENLMSYLRKTPEMGILISKDNPNNKLTCYINTNWGGEGNRSMHGYLIIHGKNPIVWQSKRQVTIASSTAQVRYIALSFAAKESLWISNLFKLATGHLMPHLLLDNKTAIGIVSDSINRKQTCHLIIEFNMINKYIIKGKIHLDWTSTYNQLADILTK